MRLTPRRFNLFGQRVAHHNPIPTGHRLEGADAPLIAERELLDLADEALIFRYLFNGNPERFCVAQFIDVRAFLLVIGGERVELPLFPRQPREHAALDVGKVRGHELVARRRANHPAQTIGDHRHRIVEARGNHLVRLIDRGAGEYLNHLFDRLMGDRWTR